MDSSDGTGAAATAKKIKSLLKELPDERADALRLDELRQLFAKLVLSGELSFPVEKGKETKEEGKVAVKWRAYLQQQHQAMVQQLCRRVQAGKRTALRCLFGVIAASPSAGGDGKLRVRYELLHKWIKCIAYLTVTMDKSMRTMIQAEFFGPFRDVQYYALQSITSIAETSYHKGRKSKESSNSNADHYSAVAERLLEMLLMIPVPSPCEPLEKKGYLFPPSKFDDDEEEDEEGDDEHDNDSNDDDDDDVDDGDNSSGSDSDEDKDGNSLRPKKRQKRCVDDSNAPSFQRLHMVRRHYQKAWLALLKLPLPLASLKRALMVLPEHVLPHVAQPLRFSDFFMQAFTTDGVVSVLALDGLFLLITTYGMEYPNFYTQLYRLVSPRTLSVKYRQRFFDLLTKCLSRNEMLPAHIVAAFCKRLCRSALSAPPPGILFVLALVSNMLRKHPECSCLIHRNPQKQQKGEVDEKSVFGKVNDNDDALKMKDAFLANEDDPVKSRALQSSLWELAVLERHYYPAVATLAKSIGTDAELKAPMHDMSDFSHHTYQLLFDRERKPPKKGIKTVLTFREPASLFPEGDVLGGILAIGH